LGTLYGQRLADWFAAHQVELRLGTPVRRLDYTGKLALSMADRAAIEPDYVVLAVPWNKLADMLSPEITRCKWVEGLRGVERGDHGRAPWFDRYHRAAPLLVGRLCQWSSIAAVATRRARTVGTTSYDPRSLSAGRHEDREQCGRAFGSGWQRVPIASPGRHQALGGVSCGRLRHLRPALKPQ
jgi:hypothetical protein